MTAMILAGLAARAAAFTSDRVTIATRGSGPDVILVPGLTSSPRIYSTTVEALPGYRYHMVQVRGFAGTSVGGNATGDVSAAVAEELARYIRESRLVRPALVGHSMGGTVGMMVAARHPDALGRLMVVDMTPFTGAFFGARDAVGARAMMAQMQKQMAVNSDASHTTMTEMIASMVKTESERPAILNDARTSHPALVSRTYAEIQATDLRGELKAVKIPMTVLYAKPAMAAAVRDEEFDAIYRGQYANAADVTLTRISDAGHFLMLDQPARFVEEFRNFLAAPAAAEK